jgi:ATP-binding cassette subfamily B multidrug efflux pump
MSASSASRPRESQAPPPILGRRGPHGPRGMGDGERARDTRGTMLRLWSYLRRQRGPLVVTAVMVLLTTVLTLLNPFLLGKAIDEYILKGNLPGLARVCLLMLAVNAANSLLSWLQAYVMATASQRTVRDIRYDLFAKLQTLSLRYFDQHSHGDLMSRVTNDIENINTVLSSSVVQLFSGVLTMLGVALMMLWINPRLAVVTLVTVPLVMLLLTRQVAARTRSGFRWQQSSLGKLNGLIEETVTGQRVVKAYIREPQVIEEFDAANRDLRRASTRAQVFSGFVGPLMNFVNNLSLAIVASVGGWMAVRGLATVGTIAAFINYARQFGRPLNQIANLYNSIQSAIAGAERVFETIDEVPELTDAVDAHPLERVAGSVEFENVCFAYEEDTPVLKHISLRARPGQTVALVGPTGAGKTTMVNLLTRFYDIDAGRILIDGHEIHNVQMDALRRQLGIVLQDTFLFSRSVKDNIRYGRLDASDDEIVSAAVLANADQFIRRLPQGYDTPLSERASNLSQGQRQLLAIARAILADPGILVLDEATSSVDTRTEKHIQEAMLRLMTGRTSFVIAHRLSTIRDADQILVIDGGRIIERGTHEELLTKRGFYYQLYASQFRTQPEAPVRDSLPAV